jgi:hypothetical protein
MMQPKNSIVLPEPLPNPMAHTIEQEFVNAHLESDEALACGPYRLSLLEASTDPDQPVILLAPDGRMAGTEFYF